MRTFLIIMFWLSALTVACTMYGSMIYQSKTLFIFFGIALLIMIGFVIAIDKYHKP